VAIIFYYHFKNKRSILFGFPGYSIIVSLIFFGLSVDELSRGKTLGFNKIDYSIFFSYIFHLLLFPLWIVIYDLLFNRKVTRNLEVQKLWLIRSVAIFCSLYMIVVFATNNVISEILRSGAGSGMALRLLMTHELNSDSGVMLKYWRLVRDLQIFSCLILIFNSNSLNVKKIEMLFYGFSLLIALLISMEKVLFVNLILIYILYNAILGNFRIKAVFFLVASIYLVYWVTFDAFQFSEFGAMILARLDEQTSSAYLHNMYIESNGYLGLKGLPLGIFSNLLNTEFFDLSKYSYDILHPEYGALGLSGSSGGIGIISLEAVFPFYGIIIYVFITTVISYLIFYFNSIQDNALRSFFSAYFAVFYVMPFIFSPFAIINPLLIFSIPVWMYLMLFKLAFKRTHRRHLGT